MDSKKYYTPSIEEFYVGFECENMNFDGTFSSFIYGKNRSRGKIVDTLSQIEFQISAKTIRVKYLDKSDIESVGWEERGQELYYLKTSDKEWCLEKVLNNNTSYRINENDFYNSKTCCFIELKNKSELKKIMSQLSII